MSERFYFREPGLAIAIRVGQKFKAWAGFLKKNAVRGFFG